MAVSIVDNKHISLNGVIYPLSQKSGYKILPGWLPRFANRINTGPDDFATEQYLSNWIIKDQRDGLGVEEMDEKKHNNRYWFGNLNAEFNGHRVLPRLATAASTPTLPTIVDGELDTWTDVNTLTNWTKQGTGTGTLTRIAAIQSGTYAARVASPTSGGTYYDIKQALTGWSNNFRGKLITITGYAKGENTASATASFLWADDDGGTGTAAITMNGTTAQYTASGTVGAAATKIEIFMRVTHAASTGGYCDFDLAEIAAIGTITESCNYNGGTYYAAGKVLLKASTNTAYLLEGIFPGTISALVPSVGNNLLVYLGDSTNYWYISSAGVFADAATGGAANCQNATKGCHWDTKAWKMNAAGQIYHCTDPARDDPTWTANGTLANLGLASGDCNNLYTDYDSTGATVIYAATKKGLFMHNTTSAIFSDTKIGIADHANAGKGFARFNDGLMMSAGLAVKKYTVPGTTAIITDEGLDQDDGLPTEYNGEIVKFIEGIGTMYALVDASQMAGLGFSAVYGYDGVGWRCIWDATLLDTWTYSFTTSSGTGWSNLANAYDNDTGTYASSPSVSAVSWCAYSQYNIGATNSHQLRFYATSDGNGTVNTIDIDVSADGSTWVDVYNGTFTADTWTSYHFALTAITNIRVRFYNTHATTAGIGYLKEIQLGSSTCDGVMHTGVVSSVNTYHLSFDHNAVIYSIPLSRNNLNPKKISTSTYAATGFQVSPWFDADTKAFSKAIKRLTEFCEDTSSTETVRVMYRLDHAAINLFTGWTDVVTISADGQTQTNLASGAGITCKSFQYYVELARTTTNTLSPDLQGMSISYRKNLGAKHAWTFTIDLADAGALLRTMISNLETAVGLETWMEFIFRDATKESSVYVEIVDIKGVTGVGPDYESQYVLTVVEV